MTAERSTDNDDKGLSKEERIHELMVEAMKILNDYSFPSDLDFDNGISLLMEAFKLGSIEAAYQIGWNYSIPNESHYDIDIAVKYLTVAADADHPRAIVKLATYYYNTEDIEQHIREQRALSLLDKIKDTSNSQAQYLKGMIYLNGMATIDCNIKNAIRCLSNAAYNKHVDAMLKLGFLYKDGLNVKVGYDINDVMYLKKNPCEAAKHFHAAASAGSATGQYEYSKMLLDGIGVTQSYVYAFYYLWSAAKQKHGKAQFELAKLYSSGYIFPEDYKTAYIWALISQSFCFQEDTNRLIESLKPKLTKHEVSSLQVKAYRYKDIVDKAGSKETPLLQEPNLYFAKNCYQEDSSPVLPIVDDMRLAEPQTETPLSNGEIEDTGAKNINEDGFMDEPTDKLEYRAVELVKKGFDPSKIKLALLLYKCLDKSDDVDFYEFKISYNNQNHDRKKVGLYTGSPVKLNKKARILLIKLALQFETKDIDKRTSDIARILHDPLLGCDVVSSINRLAKNLFPGCFPKSCPFICKESGELKISLSIDKWMIANAKDFKEVSSIR